MTEDRIQVVSKALQEMIDAGWTAAAISKLSEVNQITVGNLKNGKGSRVTDKVFDKIMSLKQQFDGGDIEAPSRGRKGSASAPKPAGVAGRPKSPQPSPRAKAIRPESANKRGEVISDYSGMINTQYVPVDVERLQAMIDVLIDRFSAAVEELESIKKQLNG